MKVALVTNPPSDHQFRSRAFAYLAEGAHSPENLRDCLQDEYPDVLVRDGIVEQGVQRWYAYRDGHWVDGTGSRAVERRR